LDELRETLVYKEVLSSSAHDLSTCERVAILESELVAKRQITDSNSEGNSEATEIVFSLDDPT